MIRICHPTKLELENLDFWGHKSILRYSILSMEYIIIGFLKKTLTNAMLH